MEPLTALTVITAASAAGEAFKIAQPIAEKGMGLLEALLDEPMRAAGGAIADQVQAWRWTNRVRIAARAQEVLNERGVQPQPVPPGFLLPLIEQAGDVEEPDLQELWAQLLASGVEFEEARHPAFVGALRAMSRDDATLLAWITNHEATTKRPLQRRPLVELVRDLLAQDRAERALSHLEALGIVRAYPPAGHPLAYLRHFVCERTAFGESLCRSVGIQARADEDG